MEDKRHYIRFSWPLGYSRINRQAYSPALTDDRVSFEQIDKFLSEVEKIYFEIMRPVYFYVLAGLTYMLISLTFNLFNGNQSANNEMAWLIEAAWYLSYLFVFTMGYFFYEYKKEKVASHLQALIQIYHHTFGSKELRWVIPGDFPEGIELWKDYIVGASHSYIEMAHNESESSKLVGGKGMP